MSIMPIDWMEFEGFPYPPKKSTKTLSEVDSAELQKANKALMSIVAEMEKTWDTVLKLAGIGPEVIDELGLKAASFTLSEAGKLLAHLKTTFQENKRMYPLVSAIAECVYGADVDPQTRIKTLRTAFQNYLDAKFYLEGKQNENISQDHKPGSSGAQES